ncbi:MAG TPA: DUF6220 domain-containing protein [Ktedonobacterales bacterium]|jgi:hypothetical protein
MNPPVIGTTGSDVNTTSGGRGARTGWRRGYVAVSAVLALAILTQVFLAGASLFAEPTWWPAHRMFGMMLSLGPVVLLALGFAARLPRRALWLTGLLLVLVVLQPLLINVPEALGLPVLEGFHVVNAVVVFALMAILGLGAWRIGGALTR